MYLTEEIMGKLNAGNGKLKSATGQEITLSDIIVRSFAEVKELAGDALTWGEKNFIYQQAQAELKENKLAESRILSRANPQLANAVRLGIRQSAMLDSYNDLFPQRASRFVKPGAVASMFSPAGYLTELYREARGLHDDMSDYHLDTRRPDLASMALSQSNMDTELSTLVLSNEILLNLIQSKESLTYEQVIEKLATYRLTGATPYNRPYEAIRQAILLQDPEFNAFSNNPAVAANIDTSGLLGITADIAPELHAILTEEITEEKTEALIKKNFGDANINQFQNISWLAHWYGLSNEELNSFLSMVTPEDSLNPAIKHYKDNSLLTLVTNADGTLNAIAVKHSGINNAHLNNLEVIPLGGNEFQLNYNLADFASMTYYEFGTSGVYSTEIVPTTTYKDIPASGTPCASRFTLSQDQLSQPVKIDFTFGPSDNNVHTVNTFVITSYPFDILLLKLNKLLRLYKATGISPTDIRTVIESDNTDLIITESVLSQLFWTNYYTQTFEMEFSAALVLAGADIGQIAHSESQPSAFNRLFNTPPLDNQPFSAGDESLDLTPDSKGADAFRIAVLKRALQVNDAELYTLYGLSFTDKDKNGKLIPFTTSIENLSALYRTRLLADIFNISVTELSMLLSVSPYASQKVDSLKGQALHQFVASFKHYMQSLKAMNWSVSDLYLMLTNSYSTVLSPEIKNLMTTLKNGLSEQDFNNTDETAQLNAMAPLIAAAMQLDSKETAAALLQWLNQLQPAELTVSAFLSLVNQAKLTDKDAVKLVSFCQVMGQLVLVVRKTSLTASELSWAVGHPNIFTEKATILGQNIGTLLDLTQLHALLARSGTHASEILTSLSGNTGSEKNNLAIKTVATALGLDEQALTQALAQVSAYKYFYSWIHLRDALQWLDVATTFNIVPNDVARMVALKYSGKDASPFADWVKISRALQAGLNTQQTAQLEASLDESLNVAVSAYVIKNSAPSWVSDRDKLYGWLLIDNQVSAQIKTTRIAEAIASVQLYVNRSLAGQEEGIVNAVRSKTFFASDWDTYNKRYSTWAGVSELVYYPENYVDPTMRIGQTGMMDEMLQTLSQSQLTSDTVIDAFKTYMTRFEEIANLDVISGYHDNVSDATGTTYILGRSAIGDYYWRSADIGKMSDGMLPANAWTEWKKITTALTPVNNLVRPVIFQSRLYVVWVESRVTAVTKADTTKQGTEYLLKYAHILHDGTWSSPVAVTLNSVSSATINDLGMYCASDIPQEKLYILFYKKLNNYSEIPSDTTGLILSDDGSFEKISTDMLSQVAGYIYKQLDTIGAVRFNTTYAGNDTEISITKAKRTNSTRGDANVSEVICSALTNMTATPSTDNKTVTIKFDAILDLEFNSVSDNRTHARLDMMLTTEGLGNVYYLPRKATVHNTAQVLGLNFELIFQDRKTSNGNLCIAYVTDLCNPLLHYLDVQGFLLHDDDSESIANTGKGLFKFNKSLQLWEKKDEISPDCYIYIMKGFADSAVYPANLSFSQFDKVDLNLTKKDAIISCQESVDGKTVTADNMTDVSLHGTPFDFTNASFTVPYSLFHNNKATISFVFSINQGSLGTDTLTFDLIKSYKENTPIIVLKKTSDGAQYLQYDVHRIRVNTLFAKQLVARANAGLNSILSMETQKLQEPKPGKGAYVNLELDTCNDNASSAFEVLMCDVFVNGDRFILTTGTLSSTASTYCSFFLPRMDESTASSINMYFCLRINNKEATKLEVSGGEGSWKVLKVKDDKEKETFGPGIINASVENKATEPMDFSGANALYFWEMFYYVPMMIFKRLLSENRFAEATQWIKYIWNPDGYIVNDQPTAYTWNVRPLQEDTSWHVNPLDSVDPDAVAQADPLHYKVATFMAYLDLLIARGDIAYRQLERDTLNEAKMWYAQALNILGDEPYLSDNSNWASPRLNEAADKTTQKSAQQAMLSVRQKISSGELHTANSLTSLFLPQQNKKLTGYWQTLAQRMYNLRHNLSIDGAPLSLAIFAKPADPAALLSAAVNASSGGSDMPTAVMPLCRFPVGVESAKRMVDQLTQFGSNLRSITERQDAEALSELMQTQGSQLILQSIALQNSTIAEIDADKTALEESLSGALSRLDSYTTLYNEDVNTGEQRAMDLFFSSSIQANSGQAFHTAAGTLDLAPNIFGMADGGSRWGAAFTAMAGIADLSAAACHTAAERLSQSEFYRRRRQEWEIQRNNAQSEVNQINAQLASLAVRREGAMLQKTYLETQQGQMQAQMTFLQNKFTSKALYNWLRGKLAAIYYQFYDLTVSRCLMAEAAYSWEIKGSQDTGTFIRPGAWQGTYAGLMAGETLMLNLVQMENSYLEKDQRHKEVTRTVCLSDVYAAMSSTPFALADQVTALVTAGKGSAGTEDNGVKIADQQLQATLKLSDLKIADDYPSSLGKTRRIKQISVTLPALVGPYQDVQAMLSYGGSVVLPRGCTSTAVSHGMNDSGQFQLDFNDSRWLPFEGIPVNDPGTLTLSFPGATGKQKEMLLSLADIILHIRYTIAS